ncbi:MAG: hypothetical protein ASARMPRED_009142 [Alectoria sarmentosa]|nr:MAG: hypothetical protein ASARMPRED_009142 [Alectoria sarmentosa]
MTTNPSLYGLPRPRSSKPTSINPSTNTAFTSTLSALLATTTTATNRPRPSKTKPSIFTAHNKGSQKRALADISSSSPAQTHAQSSEAVDAATLHRSKRKMEDKARLYASMKRGDYVPPSHGGTNREESALVDFDRKWAEREEEAKYETESDDGGESGDDDDAEGEGGGGAEIVEYEDEFGRLRRGTKKDAAREQRKQHAQAHASEELGRMKARPPRPTQLIVGDTIQAGAFNPDAAPMAALARQRDRSPTPPAEVHYDASSEVRSKGVGFYSFSKDEEGRKREMEALGREREETERGKREREERRARRARELEERRRLIAQKRGERLAERFLNGLDVP